MGELIQQILLSDIMIIIMTGAIALGITIRALSQREYAGYILGWLTGIFLVLLLSALIPNGNTLANVVPAESATSISQPLSFLAILLPGIMGIGSGTVIAAIIYQGNRAASGRLRALIVATLFSLNLAIGYVMLMLTSPARLTMGVFVLTVAIGALLHFIVVNRIGIYRIDPNAGIVLPVVPPATPLSGPITIQEASQIPVGIQIPAEDTSAANRINAIRQQFDAQFVATQPSVEQQQPPLPPN